MISMFGHHLPFLSQVKTPYQSKITPCVGFMHFYPFIFWILIWLPLLLKPKFSPSFSPLSLFFWPDCRVIVSLIWPTLYWLPDHKTWVTQWVLNWNWMALLDQTIQTSNHHAIEFMGRKQKSLGLHWSCWSTFHHQNHFHECYRNCEEQRSIVTNVWIALLIEWLRHQISCHFN